MIDKFNEKLAGSAFGVFCGDAMGAQIEGLTRQKIRDSHKWVSSMRTVKEHRSGRFTDDTLFMVSILEALSEDHSIPQFLVARHLALNFDPFRGYGQSTADALSKIRNEDAKYSVLSRDSWGNGGAMGIAPLGVFFHRDLDALKDAAIRTCSVSHTHPEALGGALAVALAAGIAANRSLEGKELDGHKVVEAVHRVLADEGSIMAMQLQKILEANIPREPGHRADWIVDNFRCTLKAIDSVPAALVAGLYAKYPKDAIEVAVNCGGDTDSIAAMAGGIAGAYFGYKAWPKEWINVLEDSDKGRTHVMGLCKKLAAGEMWRKLTKPQPNISATQIISLEELGLAEHREGHAN